MNYLFLAVFLFNGVVLLLAEKAALCNEAKDEGICKGYFPKYWFNKETKRCEEFIYGGCGGNDNNFDGADECIKVCEALGADKRKPIVTVDVKSPESCEEKVDPGLCMAAKTRYYYNKETKKCETFIYGGCGGTANNYDSPEQCLASCPEATEAITPTTPTRVEPNGS